MRESLPAPAPICFVVSTHSEPVLKKPDLAVKGAEILAAESVKSSIDIISMRVPIRQPAPRLVQ